MFAGADSFEDADVQSLVDHKNRDNLLGCNDFRGGDGKQAVPSTACE